MNRAHQDVETRRDARRRFGAHPSARRRRTTGAVLACVVGVLLAPAVVAVMGATAGMGAGASTAAVVSRTSHGDMYGRRYCELLALDTTSQPIVAKVWNTYPLNNCPSAAWLAVNTSSVAQQDHVALVVRNGPRYWAIDSVTKYSSGALTKADQGGLEMYLDATVQLANLSRTPYVEHQVARSTVFHYRAGRRISELVAPTGKTYVMQSWSQQVDPALTLAQLPQLGQLLHLPAGWRYQTRLLHAPLVVSTVTHPAVVLQDDLQDSYSLEG